MKADELDRVNLLLDYYGELLTKRQIEILEDYYHDDLTMQEISEERDITKAAVSDTIKRVVKTLETYEAKLHLIDQRGKIDELIAVMNDNKDEKTLYYINKLKEIRG